MEINEMKSFTEQLSAVMKENEQLKTIKEKYIEIAQEVNNLVGILEGVAVGLKDLAHKIDPVLLIKPVRERKTGESRLSRDESKDILRNMYEKMGAGTDIDMHLLEITYPELDKTQLYGLIARLKTMPKVMKRKEGTRTFLYRSDKL